MNSNINKVYGSVDIAKFIFAFSVIFIHAGGGVFSNPYVSTVVNAFNSLAVPFFFIASGFFFFKRVEPVLSKDAERYTQKYLLKSLKIYGIWSLALLPFRFIGESSPIVVLIKAVRVFLFIGDGQLWYMTSLIYALLIIVILKKLRLRENIIILISALIFIAGGFLLPILETTPVDSMHGLLKLYYVFFGNTIKNAFLTGMIFCCIGMLFTRIEEGMVLKRSSLPTGLLLAALFILYSILVLYQTEFRSYLLPIVIFVLFWMVLRMKKHVTCNHPVLRSMSTIIFLSHYIFVSAFEKINVLSDLFPVGVWRFSAVLVCSLIFSGCLLLIAEKYPKVKWLWQ